ncbi:T-cell surface glycoprotein CD3 delta chain [Sarcophilus harrisii]|uniref:T-cell surface glycoprotein CD3 delta chain n=1 Tax=Sarcophilus harrisii TaxID=9305 RepID=A0A7N4NU63_SARHA|nr:T-cell surface glycoprotein CD3 delta chain [Sarcophilus harrisii]
MVLQKVHRWNMKCDLCLCGLILTIILLQGSVIQADEEAESLFISVTETEDKVFLTCNGTAYSWMHLEKSSDDYPSNKSVDLGKRIQDPRGTFKCTGNNGKESPVLHIYYRMCQNCVEVTSGSLFGILIADIIATVILAIGVYCFAGHEEGYLPAFDKQILMQNDALYQPLRDRDDNSYSHIGGKQLRNK